MLFDYIKSYDAEHFSFIRVPKLLVTDKRFEHLSASAKFLYGLLLDRVGLSLQSGWIDERGNVYIYYTLNDIQEALGCGVGKAVALLAELDSKKGIGLIERVKQGQGKPDIIYVMNFSTAADSPKPDNHEQIQTSENRKSEPNQTSENRKSETAQTSENRKSRLAKNESLDFQKSKPSNTDSNKTDINETNLSFYQTDGSDGKSGDKNERQSILALSDIERLMADMAEQVCLRGFLEERDARGEAVHDPGRVRTVFSVIVEMLIHAGKSIYVDGSHHNAEYVKAQIRTFSPSDFEYVLNGLASNTKPVRNIKAYVRTAVYRAVTFSEAHYEHDENGGYAAGAAKGDELDVVGILDYGKRIRERLKNIPQKRAELDRESA
jgi:hypothetical protein